MAGSPARASPGARSARDGALTACTPEDDPTGLGFADAAVKLASTMRMNLWAADASPVEGGYIYIPIHLHMREPAS